MLLQLMGFQINLRRENDKLLIQAGLFRAQKVVLSIMLHQTIVVHIILWLPSSPITDEAALMFLPTMNIKLIIPIESLPAEATLRVAFKAALIDGSRVVVPFPHVLV